jgi:hypothetical protein
MNDSWEQPTTLSPFSQKPIERVKELYRDVFGKTPKVKFNEGSRKTIVSPSTVGDFTLFDSSNPDLHLFLTSQPSNNTKGNIYKICIEVTPIESSEDFSEEQEEKIKLFRQKFEQALYNESVFSLIKQSVDQGIR